MKIALAIVMLVGIYIAYGQETQSDWVGGPGTAGPVTTFGDLFDISSGISWLAAGQIDLSFEHNITTSSDYPIWAVHGDIDGDIDIDILVCLLDVDSIVWYENVTDEGYFWESHYIGSGDEPHTAALSDIDNDGDLDAVAGYDAGDFVVWYENDGTGGGWIQHDIDLSVNGIKTLVTADINSDGHEDVIIPAFNGDWVAWYENDGVGGLTWTKHDVCTANGPRCGNVGDLNNDGHLDIVVSEYFDFTLAWWENDGTGFGWTEHSISGYFKTPGVPWFVDIDGDTFLDVLCQGINADSLCWFENADDIGTTWIRHTIKIIEMPNFSNFCDLDQDGDEDVLLVCSYYPETTFWFENNGTGTSWIQHSLPDYDRSCYIEGLDINLDGVNEVLICDKLLDRIDWYDVFESTGVLESSILDAQGDPDWSSIDWTATTPTNTDVIFQLRSSDIPGDMGSWSTDITSPGSIDSYVTDGDNYIQYRAVLSTTDMSDSLIIPILDDITLDWTMVGITGQSAPVDMFTLDIISANPCLNTPVIAFSVSNICNVNLSVFDMSGRVVARIADGEIESGNYQVSIENLVPGIYHCRMEAGGFTDVKRLVLLK